MSAMIGFDPNGKTPSVKPQDLQVFLVAREAATGRAAGCAALKNIGDGIGEVKRIFVHDEFRGRGVGGLLMARLERAAVELGLRALRLDTNRKLGAQALFFKQGYAPIHDYNGNEFADLWMEKRIED